MTSRRNDEQRSETTDRRPQTTDHRLQTTDYRLSSHRVTGSQGHRSKKKILIVAGEPSGDLHASELVRKIRSIDPNVSFFGMGGPLMREAGVETVFDISDLALVGIVEVLKKLNVVKSAFDKITERINKTPPDLAILVDYPGFNLRLAKILKKHSIPVVYYISPQIWAWGMNRVRIIKSCVKKVIVFFGFEEEIYKKHGIDVTCVGHPLIDMAKVTISKDELLRRYGLDPTKPVVSFLAGSRKAEVTSLLPIMLKSMSYIRPKVPDIQFIVSKFRDLDTPLYNSLMNFDEIKPVLAEESLYNIVNASDASIVASGTATLEAGIIGKPFIIAYKVNMLTAFLCRLVVNVKNLGLINIIAGKEVIPEFIQERCEEKLMANKIIAILTDGKTGKNMALEMRSVVETLGKSGAIERAAQAIMNCIDG